MKWQRGRRSDNVIDRRGASGGGRGLPIKGGIGMLAVVVVGMYFGVDPSTLLSMLGSSEPTESAAPAPIDDTASDFVRVVLADTEDTWRPIFQKMGQTYEEPRLVLFRDSVRSACGFQSAAVGPFYCPGDRQVYLDLGFFDELSRRFGAPGDFAQAYVIAHEIGHHVQTLTGVSAKVHAARRGMSKADGNALSVRQELQADCYSGVWAHHASRSRDLLEKGDVEEGLRAAAAIGDDRLQKQARGYVSPESFTHGSSEQRVRWFRRGLETGAFESCDTFGSASL